MKIMNVLYGLISSGMVFFLIYGLIDAYKKGTFNIGGAIIIGILIIVGALCLYLDAIKHRDEVEPPEEDAMDE